MKKLLSGSIVVFSSVFSINASAVEVNFNPLSILSGATTVDAMFDFDQKIRFGPSLGFLNLGINTIDVRAFDIGGRGEYAFNGYKEDGGYLSGKLYYSNVNVTVQEGLLSCSTNSMTGTLIGGHMWRFDSGFSAKIGAGFKQIVSIDEGLDCSIDGTSIVPEDLENTSQFKLAYEAGVSWSF